jgi:hypothetical protein
MQPIYVAAPNFTIPDTPPAAPTDVADLLRVLVEQNREQIQLLRTLNAWQDSGPKWRAFLSRWHAEFPRAGQDCKTVLPHVERTYLKMLGELTDRLSETEPDELETDYALGEFLDRYSTRLGQLAQIINQLTPLADNAPTDADASE